MTDNLTTLKAIESLSEYGFAVIDFMNVTSPKHLVPEKQKTVEDINFHQTISERRIYI
jgi:hypothetical protein